MDIKKLHKVIVGLQIAAIAFALTTFSFNFDVSLIAFPLTGLFCAALIFTVRNLFVKKSNLFYIVVLRELLQYLPYILLIAFVFRRAGVNGTPFILDLVSVFFWVVSSGLVFIVLYFINPKRISRISKEWNNYLEAAKSKKASSRFSAKKLGIELLGWIDALAQAVFMVLLLNIFIVQLYEIPSESMVPEFLIKDRVVVFKTLSGPKFPLSEIGLPAVKKFKRGDIVVFRNPHYSTDRLSEVKTFMSQLVYMCTLTKVNLNVEPDGNPKADPLVKRVCGVGGEQLMLQDGILYSRTKESPEFTEVKEDSKWAAWNLNSVKPVLKQGIQMIPLSQADYENMLKCEELRRNLNLQDVKSECKELAKKFASYKKSLNQAQNESFLLTEKEMNEYNLFVNNELITLKMLSSKNSEDWFNSFMTDWMLKDLDFGQDLYSQANFRLNLMIKLTVGRMIVYNTRELLKGTDASELRKGVEKISLLKEAEMLHSYVYLLDRRNMPIFPSNDSEGNPVYIPENSYFMMGDNRFNSLDMRHSYDSLLTKLTPYDSYSAYYISDMAPQYVGKEKILGSTFYRFWPINRAGKPGLTGK